MQGPDDLEGRDTPSRGLDTAADFLAAAFKKAGLKSVMKDGSYFHTYEKPGTVIDSNAVKLTLHVNGVEKCTVLEPGEDVRVYVAPSADFSRTDAEVTVLDEANAASRMRRNGRGCW